jgi:hypothetical protein
VNSALRRARTLDAVARGLLDRAYAGCIGPPSTCDGRAARRHRWIGGSWQRCRTGGHLLLSAPPLAGKDDARAALEVARTLDDRWIDDGDSRAYLLAWLMALER